MRISPFSDWQVGAIELSMFMKRRERGKVQGVLRHIAIASLQKQSRDLTKSSPISKGKEIEHRFSFFSFLWINCLYLYLFVHSIQLLVMAYLFLKICDVISSSDHNMRVLNVLWKKTKNWVLNVFSFKSFECWK